MIYKNLPSTELKPSVICFGTASLGSTVDKEDSFSLLDEYIDLGGNFIDTAHVYANWLPVEKSISEKTIGMWLKERKSRDKIILGTKGAHPELSSMNIPRLSHHEIVKDLNESLKYLGTDYIDIYWLHRDDVNRPVEDILETLNEQVDKGKIRYFGCSNWYPYRIKQALDYAAKSGVKGFVANQMMWSFAVVNKEAVKDKTLVLMDEEGIKFHKDTKMAAIPYSSQAKGVFTKADMYGGLRNIKGELRELYYNKENITRFERMRKLAKELSKSITQISLAYLTSQEFVTIPIVGCHTSEQLKDSMAAGDLILSKSQLDFLESKE